MNIKKVLTVIAIIAFLTGCSKGNKNPADGNTIPLGPTLSSIQVNIFDQSCAFSTCHAGSNPAENLNLEPGRSFTNLVNVRSQQNPNLNRVEPFQPDLSYLVHKIEGSNIGSTARMPRNGEPLSKEEIDAIREWIKNGAQPN